MIDERRERSGRTSWGFMVEVLGGYLILLMGCQQDEGYIEIGQCWSSCCHQRYTLP